MEREGVLEDLCGSELERRLREDVEANRGARGGYMMEPERRYCDGVAGLEDRCLHVDSNAGLSGAEVAKEHSSSPCEDTDASTANCSGKREENSAMESFCVNCST